MKHKTAKCHGSHSQQVLIHVINFSFGYICWHQESRSLFAGNFAVALPGCLLCLQWCINPKSSFFVRLLSIVVSRQSCLFYFVCQTLPTRCLRLDDGHRCTTWSWKLEPRKNGTFYLWVKNLLSFSCKSLSKSKLLIAFDVSYSFHNFSI